MYTPCNKSFLHFLMMGDVLSNLCPQFEIKLKNDKGPYLRFWSKRHLMENTALVMVAICWFWDFHLV